MSQQEWSINEIEVTVSGFFTTQHSLRSSAGTLGELSVPAWQRDNVFRFVDGRTLTLRRTSWWRGEHELREGGNLLGRATTRGFFRREMDVEFGGWVTTLRPLGFWQRSWELVDGSGLALLEVRPRGAFRRGAYVSVLGAVDAALLVFAYYLVNVRWQEQRAAGAAAAS